MRRQVLPFLLVTGLLSGCVSTTTVTRHPDGSETRVTVTRPDGESVQAFSAAAIAIAAERQEQRAPKARVIAEK